VSVDLLSSDCLVLLFFSFNDRAPPQIYTLSLHDALPISYGSFADSISIPKKANISKINITYDPPTDLTKEEKLFWKKYTNTSGGITLHVEEYKRPTFSVSLNNFKENVSYGQEVTLTGKVLSYAKAPISNAKINAKIDLTEYATQ